jgi:hypothetical protein
MLTFRSGGWVLLMAGLFMLFIFVWAIAGAFVRLGSPLVGDGQTVESYGFDLDPCLMDRSFLVAGGLRKDALQALVDPVVIPGRDVAGINAAERGKYLVSSDRVIGVTINGESRAYPLLIMQCHEIANDRLGGVPIAVTYNPLCDSVVVFDRRVDGEILEFGVSGLLYNSNLLMYDRRPDAVGESLWCQLLGRAVTGPHADRALSVLNATLTNWAGWLADHPQTTVLKRDPRMVKRYQQTSYETYFRSGGLMFAVADPGEVTDGPEPKDRIIAVTAGDTRGVYLADAILGRGSWQTRLGDTPLWFTAPPGSATVTVRTESGGIAITSIPALWFAWHAMYPQDTPLGP